eukprot:CAMPEP_0183458500 /NCGR_PEP_ID=MMETSP0370-20130417/133622_1 /TAXON_ID=268820 /ORGANISM="Peridinium aciculiferum, Strain PAER-2" /LENGTH=94 /DNA_ID=CAMNT_0025650279 /DNA_START=368 /DNA_END=649 /DNA_ORIENTATION=-
MASRHDPSSMAEHTACPSADGGGLKSRTPFSTCSFRLQELLAGEGAPSTTSSPGKRSVAPLGICAAAAMLRSGSEAASNNGVRESSPALAASAG